jgi:hypothetical protein
MGYGNDFDNPGVRWLIDRIKRMELDCDLVRIPTRFDSFREDIIDRCQRIADSTEDFTLIAHSFGGLAGAYIDGARKRIFLSPYWGIPARRRNPVTERIVRWMGGSKIPLIPRGFGKDDLGDLARKGDIDPVPRFLTFRAVNQILELCQDLPPPLGGDIAYISEDDRIIDLGAVKESGIEVRYFKGGHQPFVVRDRERIFHTISREIILPS